MTPLLLCSHWPDQQSAAGEAAQALHLRQESDALLAAGQADVSGSTQPGNPSGPGTLSNPWGRWYTLGQHWRHLTCMHGGWCTASAAAAATAATTVRQPKRTERELRNKLRSLSPIELCRLPSALERLTQGGAGHWRQGTEVGAFPSLQAHQIAHRHRQPRLTVKTMIRKIKN